MWLCVCCFKGMFVLLLLFFVCFCSGLLFFVLLRYCVMLCCITSHHIKSYHTIYHISYHIISYHIISYHIISYHIISYHNVMLCYIIYDMSQFYLCQKYPVTHLEIDQQHINRVFVPLGCAKSKNKYKYKQFVAVCGCGSVWQCVVVCGSVW